MTCCTILICGTAVERQNSKSDTVKFERTIFIGIVLLAFALSGCFPYLATVQPGVMGKVIDAKTGRAIAGGDVLVSSWKGEVSTVTSSDGTFLVPGEQRWGLAMGAFDPVIYDCTVSVTAVDYETTSVKFRVSSTGPMMTNLGEVRMQQAVTK